LIVLMGEFGRGGNGKADRDDVRENRGHWARAWSTVLFGGGIQGGSIIGRTDHCAGTVEDRLVNIADYFATICTILGIDYMRENPSPGGRPVPIVVDAQRARPNVIREIL
jgi:hypothetical protein